MLNLVLLLSALTLCVGANGNGRTEETEEQYNVIK